MSTEFQLDNKLFANRGVIGRKNYVINMSILFLVALVIATPFVFWFFKTNLIFDYHYLNNLYYTAPFALQSLIMLALCTSVVIGISNIKRRMTDIFGKDIEVLKYIVSALYIVFLFSFFLPFNVALVVNTLFLFVGFVLMFKKGKISPQLKESVVQVQN